MGIKIIKRGAKSEPDAAPVVKAKPREPDSKAEALRRWNDLPAPDAKPRECPYCHNRYIRPCYEDEHQRCDNYMRSQGRAKPVR